MTNTSPKSPVAPPPPPRTPACGTLVGIPAPRRPVAAEALPASTRYRLKCALVTVLTGIALSACGARVEDAPTVADTAAEYASLLVAARHECGATAWAWRVTEAAEPGTTAANPLEDESDDVVRATCVSTLVPLVTDAACFREVVDALASDVCAPSPAFPTCTWLARAPRIKS